MSSDIDKNNLKLEFNFSGYRLVSTNDMYVPTAVKSKKTGRYHSFLRKSSKLIDFQSAVNNYFSSDNLAYSKDYLSKVAEIIESNKVGMVLEIHIQIPEDEYKSSSGKYLRNDTSNFIKAIEDAVCSNIGYDDTYNEVVIASKMISLDNQWRVSISIYPNNSSTNKYKDNASIKYYNLSESKYD